MARQAGLFAVLCLATALWGCTTPLDPPQADAFPASAGTGFDGLEDFLRPDEPLRVLWIHGMCTHPPGWATKRAKLVMELLSARSSPEILLGHDDPNTVQVNLNAPGGPLEITFLLWSNLTQDYKDALKFDAPKPDGEFGYTRAKLNGMLKVGLMNDCLTDAVVYSGTNGNAIRLSMQKQVCLALNGSYANGVCDTTDAAPVRLVIIAESLGSKLIFDAVRELHDHLNRPESIAALQAFNEQIGRTLAIYLVSNQIPLLDQANPVLPSTASTLGTADPTPGGSSLGVFLELVEQSRQVNPALLDVAGAQRLLPVVAFTDPNDLLSYRLTPASLHFDRAHLVNVLVSNDWTYLGLVERPDNAHCGYAINSYVLATLVLGHESDGAFPQLAIDNPPSSACFSD
jgi:hypothetical protein